MIFAKIRHEEFESAGRPELAVPHVNLPPSNEFQLTSSTAHLPWFSVPLPS